MTDEPNNPQDSNPTSPSESDETRRAPDSSPTEKDDKAPGSAAAAADDAGTLPPPPDADAPRPSPESQAALTGKAPSGSSTSGTTVPADTGGGATTPKPKPAPPPANETPEEKKARLERTIAEAKAKKEAAAAAAAQAEGGEAPPPGGKSPEVGDPLKSPSQADLERAAKLAEAKARAAAMKEAAGAKEPAAGKPEVEKKPMAPGAPKPAPAAPGAGVPKPPVKKKDEGPKPVESQDDPLFKRLRERFGDRVEAAYTFVGQLSIHVKSDAVVEVCKALRDDAETPFDYLSDLTCVHWPERDETPYEVVYNLYSVSKNARVRVKTLAGEAGVESVTAVWPAANWMEREAYDLFGVTFVNHPDLRRLLLPQDWDGHPLRKDYPLEFMENQWTTRHLPEFTEVQREQFAQRRAYGLEILQTPDERRIREIFRDGRDPLPKEHK